MLKSVLTAAAVAASLSAQAQAQGYDGKATGVERAPAAASGLTFTAEAAVAQVADLTGADLGVGGRYAWRGLRISGLVGGFVHQSEDDRYRSETFANGRTVCRDTSNGRFADDANCAPDIAAYAKLEGSWLFDERFELGGGVRISEAVASPYATLGYRWPNGLAVYGAGGDDYAALGVAFRR